MSIPKDVNDGQLRQRMIDFVESCVRADVPDSQIESWLDDSVALANRSRGDQPKLSVLWFLWTGAVHAYAEHVRAHELNKSMLDPLQEAVVHTRLKSEVNTARENVIAALLEEKVIMLAA